MKALLVGSLAVILLIIVGAVTFMIIDSANTIDAQVVTKTSNRNTPTTPTSAAIAVKTTAAAITASQNADAAPNTSAKDALNDLKTNENTPIVPVTDADKTGFTLSYQASQSNCDDLIERKQEDVDDAEQDYNDAKKAYEKELANADDLSDTDAIEEAQDEIKEKKEELDDAEKVLFAAKEDLIKTRTTCVV